jgi:nitronate monooxygenase/enoyl-[acyl-carrier protein] reductase II
MLRTPLCDLLGIDVPVLGAAFGPWEQVELAAAVCEAGGLGSVGTAVRPLADLRLQWARLRELTDRPFAINHTARPLDEAAFAATLAERPRAISFHIAVAPEHIARAHDVGILWIQQVMDVRQAEQALAAGADVIVAQGGEAGGHSGGVSTMVLVPQIVDVAGDVPVVAAGGIADGRGLAATLMLGAQGVMIGTRLLASIEMTVAETWKRRIVEADALDAIRVSGEEAVMPPYTLPGHADHCALRTLRTPFTDLLEREPERVARDAAQLSAQLIQGVLQGQGHDYLPFTGQSAGLIHEILPARDIVRDMVAQAERALSLARPVATR